MNDYQDSPDKLLDTTDCLEAIGVFKGWKNFLFVIVILILLSLQGSFWLVNVGWVKSEPKADEQTTTVLSEEITETGNVLDKPAEIKAAAKNVVDNDSNQPAQADTKKRINFTFKPQLRHVLWLVRFLNFVLIPAAILYCLTMLFSLKISLTGRLGGINHISRAFFLSLLFVVLLLPWQRFFDGVVAGAMYLPGELLHSCSEVKSLGILRQILHYLRFTVYWLVVLVLLISAQIRSARWANTILRRLEVV